MKKKKIFYTLIFIIYLVVIYFLASRHEVWRDEAQAWLIARDLNPIEVVKQMWYEGHPCLWHFILMPFAKLGFDVSIMPFISCFIMALTAFLFLKYVNVPVVIKMIILFSSPFLYYYPIISRSYCLIPLVLTLISIFYEKRHTYRVCYTLSLLLLAYTHIIVLFPSIFLFSIYVYELFKTDKFSNFKKCIIIYVLGFIFLCIQLIPSYFCCRLVEKVGSFLSLKEVFNWYIYDLLLKIPSSEFNDYVNIKLLFGFIVFALCIFCVKERKLQLFLICSLLFHAFVHLAWRWTSIQRDYIIFLFIIFAFCIVYEKLEMKRKIIICIIVCYIAVLSMFKGAEYIKNDIYEDYTSADDVAMYIRNNCPKNSVFVSVSDAYDIAVIAHLDDSYSFYSPMLDDYYTYYTYGSWYNCSLECFLDKLQKLSNIHSKVYIIASVDESMFEYRDFIINSDRFVLVFNSFASIEFRESFNIYEVQFD